MADDTTVIDNDSKFVPEPIPDNIADTEINGLDPGQTDETDAVEEVNDDTEQEQQEDVIAPAESEETDEEEPETYEEEVAPTTQEQESPEAMTGAERRLAEKAERDYISEQRQQIREYEQQSDTDDVTERMKILEARQYVDTVERNRSSVANDVAIAQNNIPFFNSGTEQSQVLFQQALENFANAYGVTDEDTGEWIAAQDRNGNDVQLLPYLQQQAAAYEQAVATAGRQAQQSEAKMRAKAVNPSNTGKVSSSGDEIQDLLDKIGDVPLV